MVAVTTRAGKGSPLTNAEIDANWNALVADLNTKMTQAQARAAISVSGSLTYNSTTGVLGFTETPLTSANIVAALGFTPLSNAGGTLSGGLTVTGNLLLGANSGSSRIIGFSSDTNTTLVLQAGASSGTGANLELTFDKYAYLDADETRLRSNDAATIFLTAKSTGVNVVTGALTQQGNQVLHASNYTSYAAPATHYHDRIYNGALGSSNYLLLSSGNELEFFNSAGAIQTLYLQYSGGVDSLCGPAGHVILNAGNYNNYAPTKTGGGASGTWGISISGNAASASTAAALSATNWQRIQGSGINYGSYGSIGISGSSNGYVGISWSDLSWTWMSSSSSGVSFGVYKTNSTWAFYFDTNGTLQSGTIPWARITNAPTSYPASDVYAWAKAASKPSYSYSEVGAAAASHNHSGTYFETVSNCAEGYSMGAVVVSNCGNITGKRQEIVDQGSNMRLQTSQWNYNCNCTCK